MNECVESCGVSNPPCEALCEEAHPDGVPAEKALRECATSTCPTPCGAGGS